jgi:hypothetical protein
MQGFRRGNEAEKTGGFLSADAAMQCLRKGAARIGMNEVQDRSAERFFDIVADQGRDDADRTENVSFGVEADLRRGASLPFFVDAPRLQGRLPVSSGPQRLSP